MGLRANIYRSDLGDCSNNGISSRAQNVTILNCDGPFEPTFDAPAVVLERGVFDGTVVARPYYEGDSKPWFMAGGTFIGTSDARFSRKVEEIIGGRFYGAVPFHDRVE